MSDSETDSASTSTPQPPYSETEGGERNLDVVNLSNQMTDMEILSKRKAKKRVRFELPELEKRPASSQDFASFRKLARVKQRKIVKKALSLGGAFCLGDSHLKHNMKHIDQLKHSLESHEGEEIFLSNEILNNDQNIEDQSTAKRLKLDVVGLDDKNNNSSASAKQCLRRKLLLQRRRKFGKIKKIKTNVRSVKKSMSTIRKKLLKKAKVVATKKRKRSTEDNKYSSHGSKRSKSMNVSKSKSKQSQNSKKKRASSSVKSRHMKKHKLKKSKSSSRQTSKGSKLKKKHKSSNKTKRSVLVAKSLKKKALKRKLALKQKQKLLAAKRIARKKAKLKKKLAEKRKEKQKKNCKSCQKSSIERQKKPKKPRFIPIIREEEVSNSMCESLLIYRTIQRAKSEHLHCCSDRCWRDWEELDIEDVYIDFE